MRPHRLIAALLVCLAFAIPVRAEDPPFDPHGQPRKFAVRDTTTVRNLIEEYRQMLEQGRVPIALRTVQRILDEHQEDYFLVHEKDARGWTSTRASVLWRAALEVVKDDLAALPASRRATYEELSIPNAAPLLKHALVRRDPTYLREVLARYGASTAGIEAGRVLTSLAMGSGRYRDAAWYAGEALRFAPDDAGLWQMRIDALAALGDRAGLQGLTLPAGLSGAADGGSVDVPRYLTDAIAKTPQATAGRDWPAWGGDSARARTFPNEAPVPRSLRWTEYTDFVERHRDRESPWYRESKQHPKFRAMLKNFRPTHPVVADRVVYASDGRSLRAHDLYSGRTLWKYDASRYPGGRGAPFNMLNPGQSYPGRTSVERAFSPIVVDDVVLGTIEERVPYIADKLQRIEISMYLPLRRLVACDKKTGDLRWVFALRGLDRLRFGHYSIVSSVATGEGLVLALGSSFEGSHNLVFFAIDAATGELRWSRELGTGQQELNLFGVPVKELAASPISVSDGIAYVSTGLGFVAALDVRTGIPRWLASYEIIPIQAVEYWYRAPLRLPKVAVNPPMVHKDVLVVAPTDGRHIYVFDKSTGRLRWRQPVVGTEASGRMDWDVFAHVLGIVNDGKRDVLLSTDRRLVARHLFDDPATAGVDEAGKLAWAGLEVPQIRGRGAIAGDHVVVPAEDGLYRYSIRAEGKQDSAQVPWPGAAEPGNVLALERVLIVAGRDSLQWFYDWEDLERDVARRRRERPDDPSILLEAGELYLRAGDETERARKAFQEALRIAKRSAKQHVAHARHGLYLAWMREGELNAGNMSKSVRAMEKALTYAATPTERVVVRMRLDRVLTEAPTARRKNLEQLEREAGDAVITIDGKIGAVSARAHALLLWAGAWKAEGNARAAVGLLQRAIRELGSEVYERGTVREKATSEIAKLIADAGKTVYAEHERKARTLVDKARRTGDGALLERVIYEYPNADVLGDALLVRAAQELTSGNATEAIELLRKVLSGHGERTAAVPALALLARAYRLDGARGAAALTLERLGRHQPSSRITIGAERTTVAAFVEAELRATPTLMTTAGAGLAAPLREVRFEPGSDDTNTRAIPLKTETDANGIAQDSGVAVMAYGPACTVFDMRTGRVAWRASPGNAQRGAWVPGARRDDGKTQAGRLILAVRDRLRGFDAGDGTEVWTAPINGFVRELAVRGAVLYAVVQERNMAGTSSLLAFDAVRGTRIWARDLGTDNPRRLRIWSDRVLLERTRWTQSKSEAHLLIYDAFDGRPLKQMAIPTQTEAGRILADGALVLATREMNKRRNRTVRRIVAYDLIRGAPRWRRSIQDQRAPVTALVARGREIVVVLSDGHVLTLGTDDGTIQHTTRIHAGQGVSVRPFVQSRVLLDADRLTFLPATRPSTRTRPAEPALMTFDRRTGKLVWERRYEPGTDVNAAAVMRYGDVIAVVISHRKGRTPHVNIRLVNADDGALLQEITPDELAHRQWIPTPQAGHGSLIVFGRRGASVFRSSSSSSGAKSR